MAVQGMREHNTKGMIMAGVKPSPVGSRSDSGNVTRHGRWALAGNRETSKKINGMNDHVQKKLREAEKAETVMHLICWGPK